MAKEQRKIIEFEKKWKAKIKKLRDKIDFAKANMKLKPKKDE
jgi:hypothetical protein